MSLSIPATRSAQSQRNWSGQLTTTTGTLITADAGTNTLGTKAEIFSSTSFDAHSVRISLHSSHASNTRTDQLMNVYVGASSAEQVLIPNLLTGWSFDLTGLNVGTRSYEFPLFIPAGSRISADLQAAIGGDTVRVMMELFGGGQPANWCGRRVECLGAVTASSRGTSVTPGGASEGTFTDIGTTTTEWKYIVVMQGGNVADTSMNGQWVAFDVGVGSALFGGLEEFVFVNNNAEWCAPAFGRTGRHCTIPASTALQLRGQVMSGGSAEAVDLCLYGVY